MPEHTPALGFPPNVHTLEGATGWTVHALLTQAGCTQSPLVSAGQSVEALMQSTQVEPEHTPALGFPPNVQTEEGARFWTAHALFTQAGCVQSPLTSAGQSVEALMQSTQVEPRHTPPLGFPPNVQTEEGARF